MHKASFPEHMSRPCPPACSSPVGLDPAAQDAARRFAFGRPAGIVHPPSPEAMRVRLAWTGGWPCTQTRSHLSSAGRRAARTGASKWPPRSDALCTARQHSAPAHQRNRPAIASPSCWPLAGRKPSAGQQLADMEHPRLTGRLLAALAPPVCLLSSKMDKRTNGRAEESRGGRHTRTHTEMLGLVLSGQSLSLCVLYCGDLNSSCMRAKLQRAIPRLSSSAQPCSSSRLALGPTSFWQDAS